MPRLTEKNNFIWLTLAMIGLMVVSAFSRDLPESVTIIAIEFGIVGLLLVSLLSLKTRHVWTKWLIAVVSLMILMALIRNATGHHHLDYFYLGLLLVFMIAAAWLVAGHVLLTGSVNLNKLVGAVALYMIIGLVWSVIYTIVLEVWPDAFHGIEPGAWYDNLPVTTYFSFVTLTTLGYGDITLSEGYRLLSGIQALNGILLVGWSTALMFAVVQKTWQTD